MARWCKILCSIICLLAAFVLYSAFDSSNFFESRKEKVAMRKVVERALAEHQVTTLSAEDYIRQNPKCCAVAKFINGSAPATTDGRSAPAIALDKFLSLFGIEEYAVNLAIFVDGKEIDVFPRSTAEELFSNTKIYRRNPWRIL